MGKRFTPADPTANKAISRADRAIRDSVLGARQAPRKIVDEFPEIFDGLMPNEVKRVAFAALAGARNDPWAITGDHLAAARKRVMGR